MNNTPLERYVFDMPDDSGRMDVVWTTKVVANWQVTAPSVYLTSMERHFASTTLTTVGVMT